MIYVISHGSNLYVNMDKYYNYITGAVIINMEPILWTLVTGNLILRIPFKCTSTCRTYSYFSLCPQYKTTSSILTIFIQRQLNYILEYGSGRFIL